MAKCKELQLDNRDRERGVAKYHKVVEWPLSPCSDNWCGGPSIEGFPLLGKARCIEVLKSQDLCTQLRRSRREGEREKKGLCLVLSPGREALVIETCSSVVIMPYYRSLTSSQSNI